MTESTVPEKKTKAELEQLIKANGGKIYQTNTAAQDTICIADRRECFFYRSFVVSTEPVQEPSKWHQYRRAGRITLFDHLG